MQNVKQTKALRHPPRKKMRGRWKWYLPFYLMMLPGLLYILINNYLPMAGIVVAFKKVNYRLGLFASPWNGIDNFKFLFKSGSLGTMLRNTILYNVVFIVIGTVLAVAVVRNSPAAFTRR